MIMNKKHLWLLVMVLMSAVMLGACSSGGGSAAGGNGGDVARATLGTSTIVATGGTGTYYGGAGGTMYAMSHSINGVTMSKYGTVDTSFTVPTYAAVVNLGTNGATVASNTTVTVIAGGTTGDPGAGVLYMVAGYNSLYSGTGNTTTGLPIPSQLVTGLKVNAGVTLTLGLNDGETDSYDWSYNVNDMGYNEADVEFTNDVEILGTVKTADLTTNLTGTVNAYFRHNAIATTRDMGQIDINAAQIFVRTGGAVITKGTDGAADTDERGGDGGSIRLYASNYFVNEGTIDCSGGNGVGTGDGGHACVYDNYGYGNNSYFETDLEFDLSTSGLFINKGTIVGNGGNGASGGSGAGASVSASSHVYNTGTITANGGTGTDLFGHGGDATVFYGWDRDYESDIALVSAAGSVFNSGALTANGGNSIGYRAGDGGDFWLASGDEGNVGNLINSGEIIANGGSITDGSCGGNGGNGGYVGYAANGAIKHGGSVTLNGGNSFGSNNPYYSDTTNAGDGGTFDLDNSVPSFWESELPVMQLLISGNISLRGGIGYNGGEGGYIEVDQHEAGNGLSTGGVMFLGYASADFSGGDGVSNGGSANYTAVDIWTESDHNPTAVENDNDKFPAGPVVNEVPMTAKGGNASGAESDGGHGGGIWFEAGYYDGGSNDSNLWDAVLSSVTNTNAILNVSGGNGGNGGWGDDGGGIGMYARGGSVMNNAELNLLAGSALHGYGGEGACYGVDLEAGVNVVNSGAIKATGGTGLWGGDSGDIYLIAGTLVTNTGKISADGGDAEVITGSGGYIWIESQTKVSNNTGVLDVTPGSDLAAGDTTATSGTNGTIWLDEVDVTPASGLI